MLKLKNEKLSLWTLTRLILESEYQFLFEEINASFLSLFLLHLIIFYLFEPSSRFQSQVLTFLQSALSGFKFAIVQMSTERL